MKVTKEYLKKLIKESLKESDFNSNSPQTLFIIMNQYTFEGSLKLARSFDEAKQIASKMALEEEDPYEIDVSVYKVTISEQDLIAKDYGSGLEMKK